ncbi:sensor histidine kinase [Nonomuraea diastatica]|uniref:histidine kinase n=1 Tax=Nonomuraea diastatica TaxID=1848329 RepID=A0A4R4WXZ4_9ACTN|nr:histidine kinase [Nonomuraea diastatica]TDD22696.1 sensor histidine kinase [Nonomuraea diastatica]
MVRRMVARARERPRVVDAALAVLVMLANVPVLAGGHAGVAGWGWLCVVCLPLVWRRAAPVLVLYVTVGLSLASYVAGVQEVHPVAAIAAAAYTVTRHRPWRCVLPPVVALGTAFLYGTLVAGLRWDDLVTLTSAVTAAVLLGVTLQTRRAYLAGLKERAERLERERDQQAHLAVAVERTRIAREVHDIVAHNLAVMVALSDGAAFTATAAPERAADTMGKVSAAGREALADMRRLLGLLRDGGPDTSAGMGELAPQPGVNDLDLLLDQVREAGVRVTLVREGVPGRWGPGAGLTIYRIVQEALTNTIKHAGPDAAARIRLSYTVSGADLEIVDDGRGAPVPAVAGPAPGGHGLAGMAERAAAYGGRIEAGPLPDGGWRVRTRLRFSDGSA